MHQSNLKIKTFGRTRVVISGSTVDGEGQEKKELRVA